MKQYVYGTKVVTVICYALLGFALMIAAIVQAVQGDWLPAIFLAIFWVGLTNNTSNTVTFNLLKRGQPL